MSSHFIKKNFARDFKNILGVTAAMTKTAKEMIQYIEEMDNGERIEFLKYLSVKHFGRKPTIEEIAKLNYEAFHGDDEK